MDFMPVSASVLVLNVPLSTTVVVVVVGFLSTIVHFLVEASRTHIVFSRSLRIDRRGRKCTNSANNQKLLHRFLQCVRTGKTI